MLIKHQGRTTIDQPWLIYREIMYIYVYTIMYYASPICKCMSLALMSDCESNEIRL